MLWPQLVMCFALAADPAANSTATVEATVQKALEALPGKTAFAFTEITEKRPRVLYGVRADERLAVGSTFKLFILGTLIDEVNADRRQIADTMLLRSESIGPPHSEMADWPLGSPVTLHTLALKMISISDNTATDHLIYLLGRENIERQMQAMGHGAPAINRPLLSTREMTMLRDKKQNMPARQYLKLDEAARRKYLDTHFQGSVDYEQLDFDTAAYELSEWYASPLDMAQALTWIYRHTMSNQPAHKLRDVLTVETKLSVDRKFWPFVGFKGGSEDQILAGNWLLQNRSGKWYTLHVYCNSPDRPVKPEEVIKVVQEIFKAIEPMVEPTGKSLAR